MLLMILYCIDEFVYIIVLFAVDIVFLKIEKSNKYYQKNFFTNYTDDTIPYVIGDQ